MILLGTGEAARRLGVYPDTLKRWERDGKIQAIRDSAGRRLFTPEQISELAKRRGTKTGKQEVQTT